MSSLRDFTNDPNPRAIYTAEEVLRGVGCQFPDYATEHGVKEDELTKLANAAFADPVRRHFPLHTKSATFWSAAYFYADDNWQEGLDDNTKEVIDSRITKAAAQHGITEHVKSCKEVLLSYREMQKVAAEQEEGHIKCAFEVEEDDGTVTGYYPINTVGNILKSASQLDDEYLQNKIPIDWYCTACRNIYKEAKAKNVDLDRLPSKVRQLGEPRLPDFDSAMASARLRKQAGITAEQVELYENIVKEASAAYTEAVKKGSTDDELCAVIDKYVGEFGDLDKILNVKCAGIIRNAGEVFYSGSSLEQLNKQAHELVLFDDVLVPRLEVGSLKDDVIDAHFRKEAAYKVKQLRDTARTSGMQASVLASQMPPETRLQVLEILVNP